MGCNTSSAEPKGFLYTNYRRIDTIYEEAREVCEQLTRESGPLIVALDTFLTVIGSPAPPYPLSCGLFALFIPLIHDLQLQSPLPLQDSFPGLTVLNYKITSIALLRAWEVWVRLSKEIGFALDYLTASLPRVIDSGFIPFRIDREIAGLSINPDIRPIDLRKLRKVTESNSRFLFLSCEELHKTVARVRSAALETIEVVEALKRDTALQTEVVALGRAGDTDPGEVWRQKEPAIRSLVTQVFPQYLRSHLCEPAKYG